MCICRYYLLNQLKNFIREQSPSQCHVNTCPFLMGYKFVVSLLSVNFAKRQSPVSLNNWHICENLSPLSFPCSMDQSWWSTQLAIKISWPEAFTFFSVMIHEISGVWALNYQIITTFFRRSIPVVFFKINSIYICINIQSNKTMIFYLLSKYSKK